MSKSVTIVAADFVDTPVGVLSHTWTAKGLYRLRFNDGKPDDSLSSLSLDTGDDPEVLSLTNKINDYFSDGETDFTDIRVDSSRWSPFFGEVYQQCRSVSPGSTISYAALSQAAGRPRAARAVGQAMARNRIPLVIPCHRVVGSSGALTGFSAPGGLDTKRWLLEFETQPALF